jgi:hypothetical protein
MTQRPITHPESSDLTLCWSNNRGASPRKRLKTDQGCSGRSCTAITALLRRGSASATLLNGEADASVAQLNKTSGHESRRIEFVDRYAHRWRQSQNAYFLAERVRFELTKLVRVCPFSSRIRPLHPSCTLLELPRFRGDWTHQIVG